MVLSSRSVPLEVAPRFQVNRTIALASAVSLNAAALLLLSLMGEGVGLTPETAKRHVIIADWIVPRPVVPPPPPALPTAAVRRNTARPAPVPEPAVVSPLPSPVALPEPVRIETGLLPATDGVASPGAETGEGVTTDRSAPGYDHAPPPRYPSIALRKGWQGTVLLSVLVGADGRVEQVRLQRGSGHRVLDQQALQQVREEWRFLPAWRDGRPVAAWASVPVEFRIDP